MARVNSAVVKEGKKWQRLLLVGVELVIAFAALAGLSAVGWAKQLHPFLYGLVIGAFALTFLNEDFTKLIKQNLAVWYGLAALVGAAMLALSLIGFAVQGALPSYRFPWSQWGELARPENWFWYGLWLAATGVITAICLIVAEDMEKAEPGFCPNDWVDVDL